MNREDLRHEYRPEEIRILFVAESPPIGGTFFYAGDSNLARYTKDAFGAAYRCSTMEMANFLKAFRAAGCYLDDLCLEPVNQLGRPAREAARGFAVAPLSERLRSILPQPQIIVPMMMTIETHIKQAVELAGLSERLKPPLPFPSMGNQTRYVTELGRMIHELREAAILPSEF
jgi:hypothetical protein